MNTTAKLLLHCPDQPGILAEVTNFITINKGNIVYLDQYVDHVENIFFMRIEWEIKDFFIPKNKIIISESGLKTIEDIEYMKALGVNGVLIGETLIKNLNNEEFKEGLNNLLLCK